MLRPSRDMQVCVVHVGPAGVVRLTHGSSTTHARYSHTVKQYVELLRTDPHCSLCAGANTRRVRRVTSPGSAEESPLSAAPRTAAEASLSPVHFRRDDGETRLLQLFVRGRGGLCDGRALSGAKACGQPKGTVEGRTRCPWGLVADITHCPPCPGDGTRGRLLSTSPPIPGRHACVGVRDNTEAARSYAL